MKETTGVDRRRFCMMAAGAAGVVAAGDLLAGAATAQAAEASAKAEGAAADSASADADAAAAAAAAVPPIYVVDRYETQPGDGEAFLNDYLERYAPLAQSTGAELVSTLVAPPCWLPMDSNVLTFTWKVAGVGGCWGIDTPLRPNPDVQAWWDEVRGRTVSMDRSYFADPADMEVLNNV